MLYQVNSTKWAKLTISGLAIGLFAVSTASAYDFDSPAGYVGAKYGAMSVDSNEFDDDSTAYQIFAGAPITSFLSLEAGFHDFGEYGSDLANVEAKGYSVAAAGHLPLTDSFGLVAKVGNLWWDAEYNVLGLSGESDNSDIYYGIGAQFEMTENLNLSLNYDRYKIDLSDEFDSSSDYEADLNLASVGIAFDF